MSTTTAQALPRGVRNNNPGNIRLGTPWDGLQVSQTDKAFCQFVSPQYGIRALCKLLLAYQDFHDLKTVRGMINRWAPPEDDNDTSAYVHAVASEMLVSPDQVIDCHDAITLEAMATAIIHVECAHYAYPTTVIRAGVAMADPGHV